MSDEHVQRKLAAIFLADVVGYSRLMRDDEVATVNTLSSYREVMSTLVRQHRGRVVDTSGDTVLVEFSSVVDAVQGAVAIQKELRVRNAELPGHRRMEFRIGINIGDVIQEGDRIYGDGVNIAARLETLAEPGGICISRMAYDQIESKLPLGYEYMGEQVVKNINRPLHAYRVVIDPGDRSPQESDPRGRNAGGDRPRVEREAGGKGFEGAVRRVGRQAQEFVRAMTEDAEIRRSVEEIKGRYRAFAREGAHGPDGRARGLRAFIHSRRVVLVLGITGALFVLNALTSYGTWWFQFPAASLGLLVYLHWIRASFLSAEQVDARRARLLQQELSRLDPGWRDTGAGRARAERRAGARARFYGHVYVYAGVNTFLLFINVLTSPLHWWFHFPLLGWGIGLFVHWLKLK